MPGRAAAVPAQRDTSRSSPGKLALSFLLINVATYLSFGLAHRLVRAELGQLPVEPEQQASILRRMRGTAWVAVGLAAYTTWVGLRLLR